MTMALLLLLLLLLPTIAAARHLRQEPATSQPEAARSATVMVTFGESLTDTGERTWTEAAGFKL